ncbi:MAG: response regulator [Lachnospiraceae bacterium]
MIKILLIGMFNRVFEELNEALQTAEFNVQISAPDMNSVRGIVKLSRPDVIVVSLNGLTGDAKVLHGLYDKVSNIPAICYGTDFEQRQYDILRLTNFFHIVTKVDNYNNLFSMVRSLAKKGFAGEMSESEDAYYFEVYNDGETPAQSSSVTQRINKPVRTVQASATEATSDHGVAGSSQPARKQKKSVSGVSTVPANEMDYHNTNIGGGGVIVGAPIATIATPGMVKQNIHPSASVSANQSAATAVPASANQSANASATADSRSASESVPTKKTILVVDDSKAQLMVMNRILSARYEVHLASDAMRAMKMLGKSKPDAILLDYEMPDINGKRTFEMIREMEDTQDIPVIFLTGERSEENVRAVMAMKPAGYLLKPASAETIFEILDRVIGP